MTHSQESASQRARFFRQSGWMVSATLVGGICMFAVHVLYPVLEEKEYGLFTVMLAMLNVLTIPALGLQITFAHQAAAAVTPEAEARLAGTVRSVLCWALGAWAVFAVVVGILQEWVMSTLAIPHPLALWLVVLFTLCLLWQPVLFGVLQGRQNFLWLGWALITNGAGRLVAALTLVFVMKWLYNNPQATQALTGALLGIAGSVLLAGCHTRDVWRRADRQPIEWKPWLQVVLPLTLGLGAYQFLFSVDVLIVRKLFLEDQTGNYNAAGTIGRGLVMFTAPLAAVMFPKIVRSRATGKPSQLFFYTLLSVAVMGVFAATTCTLGAWFVRHVVEHPDFQPFWAPSGVLEALRARTESMRVLGLLIPWFVWCMLPLALSNVLLNNLLAHKDYRIVPYLLLVVAAYVATLMTWAPQVATDGQYGHFTRVVQVLGLYCIIFLGVCIWFSRRLAEVNGPGERVDPPVPA